MSGGTGRASRRRAHWGGAPDVFAVLARRAAKMSRARCYRCRRVGHRGDPRRPGPRARPVRRPHGPQPGDVQASPTFTHEIAADVHTRPTPHPRARYFVQLGDPGSSQARMKSCARAGAGS